MSDPIEVRMLAEQSPRVETGPVRFGTDWTGTFVRGDDAFMFAYFLRNLLANPNDFIARVAMISLANLLEQCDERKLYPDGRENS